MRYKKVLTAAILLLVLPLLVAGSGDSILAKGMKQVPFEVINKSGQEIYVRLYRYEDDYPSKLYYFTIQEGTRKRPKSGTWEVWKGDYHLLVMGSDMNECFLPIDIDDKEAGIEIIIKGRFRLVVPPCQEVFKHPGERSQLKYNWSNSYTEDPETGEIVPYRNWFTILGDSK